jgi:bacterioferritin (cytochrome b1)
MSDYTYWQKALAGEFGPMHDGDAQPGFWRKRASRGGSFVPVAIWEQDGALVAVTDGKSEDASAVWSYVCRYPVTEEAYRQRVETGKWPDEDAAVAASQEIGANNPPTDPLTDLRGQIETALKGVADYAAIASDESAAKAQGLRSRLLELSGSADKKRETEKAPHLAAGKAVDEAWQPLVKTSKAGADTLRTAISAFETAKLKAEQAARAKAAQEEAERQAELAAARKAAEEAGQPIPEPEPAPQPPPNPEPVQTQVRGAYGRAATKKMVKVAIVTDQDKAYAGLKTHKELKELIAALAQRAVNAGIELDGVTVEERIDVR